MAYPTINARTETSLGAGTTLTINFTQTTGDLVVIFLGLNDTAQSLSSVGDSFTNLTNTSATFHVLYKVLTGSEGGNMAVTVGSSTKGAAIAYNISANTFASIAPAISTVATGTSTAPNATSCAPTGGAKDYLWITAFRQNGEEADDDTWVTGTPTNFGNLTQTTSGTASLASSNGSIASADYTTNASSLDAAAFTTAQSLAWRAYTVAIYPANKVYAQSQATIKISDVQAYAQSLGQIKVLANKSYAQAQAKIKGFVTWPSNIVIDTFNRTVSGSFGTAEKGGNWAEQNTSAAFPISGATYNVNTSYGQITLAGSENIGFQELMDIRTADVEILATLSTSVYNNGTTAYIVYRDILPWGGSVLAALAITPFSGIQFMEADNDTTYYRGSSAAITYVEGASYNIKLTIKGSNHKAKVWNASESEPESYTLETTMTYVTLPGAVGFVYQAATSGSYDTLYIDNYYVRNLESQPFAQALATITVAGGVTTYKSYAQAQAKIRDAYELLLVADGASAIFPLDEASGSIRDTVNGLTGTTAGTPTYGVTSPIKNHTAIDFDSASDAFTVGDNAALDLASTDYTIEAWITRDVDQSTVYECYLYKGVGSYVVGVDPDQHLYLSKKSTGFLGLQSNSFAADGTWHHVVWTVTTGGTITLYVDGSSETLSYTNYNAMADTTDALLIGNNPTDSYWSGKVSYVAIYKSALTQSKVLAHYELGRSTTRVYAQTQARIKQTYPFDIYIKNLIGSGAVAIFALDEASGNLVDLVAGKTATANGSPTYGVTGPVVGHTAIDFNSNADYFSATDHADFDLGNGPFTVEFWYAADSQSGGSDVFLYKGANAINFGLGASGAAFMGKAGVAYIANSSTIIPINSTWHHYAWTRVSGASTTGDTKLYVDGSPITLSFEGYTNIPVDTADPFIIGRENTTEYSHGKIAFVAIFKTVLTETQIWNHWAAYDDGIASPTYAQAQTTISIAAIVTYKGYAQSQSHIKFLADREYAQAQARIKQTYQVWAQGQAQIKTTYRGYAQSNVWIKDTGLQVYAQGQGQIKTTYRGYAQAQGQIKTFYQVWAQGQAKIKGIAVNGYAQTQAQIKITYRGFAQTQSQIKTTYRGYAQANAQIKQVYQGYAQSQARIKQIYQAYGQSNTTIILSALKVYAQSQGAIKSTSLVYAQSQTQVYVSAITSRVYAQSQTQVKTTTLSYAQVLALVKAYSLVYAQAHVWIKQTYPLVIAGGDAVVAQDSFTYTSGSHYLIDHTPEIGTWTETYRPLGGHWLYGWNGNFAEIESTSSGEVFASAGGLIGDSYVQANTNVGNEGYTSDLFIRQIDADRDTFYGGNIGLIWRVTNGVLTQLSSVLTGYWWIRLQATGSNPTYLKLEGRSTEGALGTGWQIEVSDNTAANNASSTGYAGFEGYGFYNDPDDQGTTTWVDGFKAVAIGAGITIINPTYAQSQAKINAFAINNYAQSQARIKTTYLVYGQAQSQIKTYYRGYAQALAKIKQVYQVYGQSQTQIEQSYQGYAQAQGKIILSGRQSYGQTQAQIEQTYQVYAQAQVTIEVTTLVYAQAQSKIIQTYRTYAQAQVQIKAVTLVYAQSNAHIRTIGLQIFAQGQARIKQTYIGSAQANAYIKLSGLRAYGQARVWIKQTYPHVGSSVTVITIQDGHVLQSEKQQITVAATDGTWGFTSWLHPTLYGGNPGPSGLAWNISAGDLSDAIHAWSGINEWASVEKVGNVYTLHFVDGAWVNQNLLQVTVDRGGTVVTTQQGGSENEIQQITVAAIGGTWDLHLKWWFDLLDIPWDVSAASLESQLETLMDAGDVLSVTKAGSVYTVEFIGSLESSPQDQMTADGSNLVGGIIGPTFAQSQAKLNAFNIQSYAQASVWMEGAFTQFAQSQAKLNAFAVKSYGQSQVWVKASYVTFAQAQTQIKTTYLSSAQTLANIKATSTVYAQVQAQIKTTYQAYAQANTYIKVTGNVTFAQAQAQIKTTYKVYAQAQGIIVASYYGYAQAQSHIVVRDIEAYAQASATISAIGQGYSQAEVWIYIPQIARPIADISNDGNWVGTVNDYAN
jgi:hypothetical protein